VRAWLEDPAVWITSRVDDAERRGIPI
jgi:hypothetical protein